MYTKVLFDLKLTTIQPVSSNHSHWIIQGNLLRYHNKLYLYRIRALFNILYDPKHTRINIHTIYTCIHYLAPGQKHITTATTSPKIAVLPSIIVRRLATMTD